MEVAEAALVEAARGAPSLERTEAWAMIGSGTGNLPGLSAMAERLAAAFTRLPGEVRLVEPAPVEAVDRAGRVVAVEHGRHLHLSVRPQAPVRLLLTGHMDTVYPADHPVGVTRGADGMLHGPGTADMKGGLAVMLAALEAVEAAGLHHIGYEVVIGSDEETGSHASAGLIAEAARGKAAALTFEPALIDGSLVGARGGTGNFAIIVHGKAAHAGRNPEDGRNAIVAVSDLVGRLAAVAGPGLTVNPARIDGGGANNVVPDLAILRVNFRPADADAVQRAQVAIDEAMVAVAAAHDVRVELHGGFNRPPRPVDAGMERLMRVVEGAGGALGLPVAWRATGGVCDGNLIAAAGVPVIDTMGVRGGGLHSVDEFMVIESLAERAGLAALTIMRLGQESEGRRW